MGFVSDGSLCNQTERITPRILFSCPRPKSSIGGRFSTQMGQYRRVHFSSLRIDQASAQQSKDSSQLKDDFGSALVAVERVVRGSKRSSVSSPVASARQTRPTAATTLPKFPRQSSVSSPSLLETIERLLRKEGYSAGTAEKMSHYLRQSSAAVYQAKWATFTKWCASKNSKPLKSSVPDITDFLVHLRDEVGMSIPAIKGVCVALGQVFLLKGIDLGSSRHISMLIRSFEQACPPQASRVPQWDVARVLKMLSEPPFEPLKDIVDRDLTLKTVFLLALASAKRVGEIHGLSYEVSHSKGWRELSFRFVPSFVAKTQNPAVWDPKFEGFSMPAIPWTGSPEDLKLCPVRAVRKYLERTANLRPGIKNLFVSTGTTKKQVSKNTISYWLRQVIVRAYSKVGLPLTNNPRPHDIRGISTSLAFERNMAVAQILRAGTWSNQSTFTTYYLKDCSRKSLDGFSIGTVISTLQAI
ncbi:uncharacterized protein [Palaemon carinicauda]|uniref:uncharacterized protein n=1 Tax=Palaemon carinicauda TaxID=392227 RepID=UPI0035B6201B